MGSYAGNGSGDIFVTFSTANAQALHDQPVQQMSFIGNDHIDPLFEATVQAAEESIVNAMIAARDMQGDGGPYAKAISQPALVALLKRFNRYRPPH
jgi:D-aminopeptidase